MFREFIDEVGHHDLKSSVDPNHQYLGLTGVIMPLAYETNQLAAALDMIKALVFGSPNIVLHRLAARYRERRTPSARAAGMNCA